MPACQPQARGLGAVHAGHRDGEALGALHERDGGRVGGGIGGRVRQHGAAVGQRDGRALPDR